MWGIIDRPYPWAGCEKHTCTASMRCIARGLTCGMHLQPRAQQEALMMLGNLRSLSVGAQGGPALWLDDELQQVCVCARVHARPRRFAS